MSLLSLDDPRWSALHHAYGAADDVPRMLRALARGEDRRETTKPREGPWDAIWSALCHQGDVYTATYAALPHVVAIGTQRPAVEQPMFWGFAAAVAISSHRASMPTDLRAAYDVSVRDAERSATACLVRGISPDAARTLLWAISGLRGWRAVARAVEGLGDEELAPKCPKCTRRLYVSLGALPFIVADEDPVGRKKGNRSPLVPRIPRTEIVSLAQLARAAALYALADKLVALDADVTCPACAHTFSLVDVETD